MDKKMENLKGIAFFDLDGTLLDASGQVTQEIKDAMLELKANHILPVIATGRPPAGIEAVAREAGIDSFIAMNGMYIQVEGKVVYTETIAPDLIDDLLSFTRQQGGEMIQYSHEAIYQTKALDLSQFYLFNLEVDEKAHQKLPINMVIVESSKPETDHLFREQFPELNFFRNAPLAIDVVKAGIDKGTGTVKLAQAIGARDVPTYAFGDGENDFHMFQEVTHAIAMGNGIPAVKEIAEFVTTENTNHGIVNGLKHFGLINTNSPSKC
jgi:Cof subfamily protein (haloacid dehalogenase superfamily)